MTDHSARIVPAFAELGEWLQESKVLSTTFYFPDEFALYLAEYKLWEALQPTGPDTPRMENGWSKQGFHLFGNWMRFEVGQT